MSFYLVKIKAGDDTGYYHALLDHCSWHLSVSPPLDDAQCMELVDAYSEADPETWYPALQMTATVDIEILAAVGLWEFAHENTFTDTFLASAPNEVQCNACEGG